MKKIIIALFIGIIPVAALAEIRPVVLKLYKPAETYFENVDQDRIIARMNPEYFLSNNNLADREPITLSADDVKAVRRGEPISQCANKNNTCITALSEQVSERYLDELEWLRLEQQWLLQMVNSPSKANNQDFNLSYDYLKELNDLGGVLFGAEYEVLTPNYGIEGGTTEITTTPEVWMLRRQQSENSKSGGMSIGSGTSFYKDGARSIAARTERVRKDLQKTNGSSEIVTDRFFQTPDAGFEHTLSKEMKASTSCSNSSSRPSIDLSDESDIVTWLDQPRDGFLLEAFNISAQNADLTTNIGGASFFPDSVLLFQAFSQLWLERSLKQSVDDITAHRDGYQINTFYTVLFGHIDCWYDEWSAIESILLEIANKEVKEF